MPSPADFVTRALKLLQVISAGDTPGPEDIDDGFQILKDWWDALPLQRKTLYTVTRTEQALVAGQRVYTIGTGGNWNQDRPVWIVGVGLIPDPGVAQPMELPLGLPETLENWRRITQKTAESTYPTRTYYDRSFSGGLGQIEVYPVPTSSTPKIVLYTPGIGVSDFGTDPTVNFTFPPGYARMIRYNLAVECGPAWEVEPSAAVQRIARESLAAVKRANTVVPDAVFDAALTGIGGRVRNFYTLE